jgi:hypothetical protein
MLKKGNFEIKEIKLNGKPIKAIVPKKLLSLEEAVKIQSQILSKHLK